MDHQRTTVADLPRRTRPQRSKRCSRTRRAFGCEDRRPPKRLFTPEIKRFLKDWLIRRRDNPYPNRDEKKSLAVQTGLTYIQVCNWFANWRRKLKNAGKEPQRKTWGHLIKTYNSQAQGNVEHFSICSNDSIWEENEALNVSACQLKCTADHSYTSQATQKIENADNNNLQPKNGRFFAVNDNPFSQPCLPNSKYKNHLMEKYLRDCRSPTDEEKPSMIAKWLESAANFRPSENNYVNWTPSRSLKKKCCRKTAAGSEQHGKEELDAAEALAKLANAK